MKKEKTNVVEATKKIECYCISNPHSNATCLLTKVIVGLYAIKQDKYNFNIHEMFLLDSQNFENLNLVLKYLHETNKSPCQLFEQSFIDSLRTNLNK